MSTNEGSWGKIEDQSIQAQGTVEQEALMGRLKEQGAIELDGTHSWAHGERSYSTLKELWTQAALGDDVSAYLIADYYDDNPPPPGWRFRDRDSILQRVNCARLRRELHVLWLWPDNHTVSLCVGCGMDITHLLEQTDLKLQAVLDDPLPSAGSFKYGGCPACKTFRWKVIKRSDNERQREDWKSAPPPNKDIPLEPRPTVQEM